MAIASSVIATAILSVGQATFPGSQQLPVIAAGVGRAVATWIRIPTNVLVQGATTGVAGGGVVSGKLFVAAGGPLVAGALRQAGVAGVTADGLGGAVGFGVSNALRASAQYLGTSFGVGVGSDVSKVSLAVSASLIGILMGSLVGHGLAGVTIPRLAMGLGNGIAAIVQTGYGFGAVTGVPSPTGAVGTSVSSVI